MKRYSLYLAAFLAMITSAMSSDASKTPNVLQVEVLIFSGRPNPVYTITDPAQIDEIIGQANALPSSTEAATPKASTAPALGYRGIVVENLSSTKPDVQAFSVHRGHVQLLRKQKSQLRQSASAPAAPLQAEVRSDSSAALETKLLNLAHSRGVIDDGLLEHINRTK